MSLQIGDSINTASQQSLVRSSAPANLGTKRSGGQMPEGSDVVSRPKSLAEQTEIPVMRANPAASTDDPLQRLHETNEPIRPRNRAREEHDEQAGPSDLLGVSSSKIRCPYDPPPQKQRDLDLLA